MLITLFVAALAVLNQGATPPPNAGTLVSRMLARYHGAKTLAGTIRTTQVAGTASVVTDTTIAYERPSKIRIAQHQKSSTIDRSRLLVSDGARFAYTPPDRILGARQLTELVKPEGRDAQTVGDLYTVVATDLPDRSPVLDLLVARLDDLKYFTNQLATWKLAPSEVVEGRAASVVEGDWRESDMQRPSGRFKLYISEGGDLLRYVLTQKFAAPATTDLANPTPGDTQVTVVTTWDVKIQINAPITVGTFVLRTP